MKNFKLSAADIQRLIPTRLGCIASDKIVVDGSPVGYMYKDKPINPQDSGWRFLSGEESDEYMADNSRHGVYSLNTLANYDRDIIPLLGAAVGSSFERVDGGPLMEIWDEDA